MSRSNSLLLVALAVVRTISCKFKVQVHIVFRATQAQRDVLYLVKSKFWLSILLSSHLVHCKYFSKFVFIVSFEIIKNIEQIALKILALGFLVTFYLVSSRKFQ